MKSLWVYIVRLWSYHRWCRGLLVLLIPTRSGLNSLRNLCSCSFPGCQTVSEHFSQPTDLHVSYINQCVHLCWAGAAKGNTVDGLKNKGEKAQISSMHTVARILRMLQAVMLPRLRRDVHATAAWERKNNGLGEEGKGETTVLRVSSSVSHSLLLFSILYLVAMETHLQRLSREASQLRYLVW